MKLKRLLSNSYIIALLLLVNRLSANPTKWSNTHKQIVGNFVNIYYFDFVIIYLPSSQFLFFGYDCVLKKLCFVEFPHEMWSIILYIPR